MATQPPTPPKQPTPVSLADPKVIDVRVVEVKLTFNTYLTIALNMAVAMAIAGFLLWLLFMVAALLGLGLGGFFPVDAPVR